MDTIRYLGLVFDSRLSWLPHFRYTEATCLKAALVWIVVDNFTEAAAAIQSFSPRARSHC